MSAPNVTDKRTFTEGIRTTYPQFECPNVLPTELIVEIPLLTACTSTVYQRSYTYNFWVVPWISYICHMINNNITPLNVIKNHISFLIDTINNTINIHN